MSGTLVLAEHLGGKVRDVTLDLVTAAQGLPRPVTVAVIAASPEALLDSVDLVGVDEIVAVRAGESDDFENDVYQQALDALLDGSEPEVILAGFTVNSMGYAPAVAARRELGFASDVFSVEVESPGTIVATRAFYGSKVHGELTFAAGAPVLLLLRPTVWAPATPGGSAARRHLSLETTPSRARHRGYREPPPSEVDITTSDFLLSIGRGIGERDNIERFVELAEKMGATLAVSRPIVDAGWMPSARQVGQSGKTVKPKVYLAFGISGAVQHLAGMKGAGTIIAVNSDPDAAIFSVADFGAVLDLFDVADELDKLY